MAPPPLRVAVKATGFLAVYLVVTLLLHGDGIFSQAVLWLPTGVAVAGLCLFGWRYWPIVALGTILNRHWAGYTFPSYVPAVLGNTLEALVAVLLLRRLGFRQDFRRLRDGLLLVLVALVAPVVSATIGRSLFLAHIGRADYFDGWAGWWRMNGLGILVVVPLVLAWAGQPRPRPRLGTILEAAGLTGLVLGMIQILVGVDAAHREMGMVLSYLALPLTLYAALRFGVRGAVTAATGVMVLITLGTSRGFGPFVTGLPSSASPGAHELALQALIAVVTTTPLLLAAAIAEREDATARATAERLRHEEFLSSVDQNVNEGLFRLTPAGTFAYVNAAFARMLGYESPDELLGRPFVDLLVDRSRAAPVRQVLQTRGHVTGEAERFRRRDGSVLQGLVSCTVVRSPEGGVSHYDGAVSDLTDYKRLEDQLRQTQKMEALGKLAGGVAHDFNNLLTVISGHAELLRESLRGAPPGAAHAQEIHAAATRAARLTSQLLAYSRRQVLDPEVLDLREVVEQSYAMLRRLIGEDVRLEVEQPDEELFVRVDRGQMEQVIVNLVVNARDAMPDGGRIALVTSRFGPGALPRGAAVPGELPGGPVAYLSVRDTGLGMSPEVVRQAFDPFFTTKEPGRGTGLGLSTVYGIVHQSGGVVWLESAPGAGTTAWVCLPLVAKSEAAAGRPAATEPAVAAAAATRGTVLVVEDEPPLRELLAMTLRQAGCEVLTAEDGETALATARGADGAIDLVLTDVVMPQMGGRELVTRLAAERPGLRVLMITGYALGSPDWLPPDGTSVAYLPKPFTPSALLERVRDCLAGTVGADTRART